MIKRIIELITGWSNDEKCPICGSSMTSYDIVSKEHPTTGAIMEVTIYKTCSKSGSFHVMYSRTKEPTT